MRFQAAAFVAALAAQSIGVVAEEPYEWAGIFDVSSVSTVQWVSPT